MKKEYKVMDNGFIQYEENGFLITIPNDPANSDYQAYLNPVETNAEQAAKEVKANEAKTK
jgi:hypothetical protein